MPQLPFTGLAIKLVVHHNDYIEANQTRRCRTMASPTFEQMNNMSLAELKAWHDYCISQLNKLKEQQS